MQAIVVIPTYNEKENIESIVRKVMQLPIPFHLLIVDDSSPDGTADIVKSIQNEYPDRLFIESRKGEIIHYWNLINENQSQRFQKEIRVALLGNSSSAGWQKAAISQLQSSCNYLIAHRGYQEWKI